MKKILLSILAVLFVFSTMSCGKVGKCVTTYADGTSECESSDGYYTQDVDAMSPQEDYGSSLDYDAFEKWCNDEEARLDAASTTTIKFEEGSCSE